jgi:hypothetical protein
MSLREILGDTLKALALKAHEKGIELLSDIEPTLPGQYPPPHSPLPVNNCPLGWPTHLTPRVCVKTSWWVIRCGCGR